MARSVILVTRLKFEFVALLMVSTSLVFDDFFNLIGKQAKGMNVESGRGRVDDKGPLPRVKSMSLKVASPVMKKKVVAPRLIEACLEGHPDN
ncbi:hypothetical protein H5410_054571 [Solanum commersonii]|uniref:Uncharacterized protein n=1 Tax=Solanum commersonii TaxID=4109 RepID=A0A9J5WG52_SOLCO|nr:hypothetical protein H5410_054571 [Solanum commersonii]